MKPIHVKIAKIIAGLMLTVFASIVVYKAISFDVVHSRGHSYSLADSPESFYFIVGIHILMIPAGFFWSFKVGEMKVTKTLNGYLTSGCTGQTL
ncbi:hypothetical protein [Halomonas tibetensis]|uniref:Uncharacterized protein n=1 Tax=Halomonas tibetensis TaxID=2259590 RepID=A0ABV7B6T1_9GAMM